MEKRPCPRCEEMVPVVDESIGTIVTCPFCDASFLVEPLCPRCGRVTRGGACDCGAKLVPNKSNGWSRQEATPRTRAAHLMLGGSLLLAVLAIVWFASSSGVQTVSSQNLLKYAPSSTVGFVLASAPDLAQAKPTAAWAESLLARLPSHSDKVVSAALFIFPAPHREGEPFRLLAAGAIELSDVTRTQLAQAAAGAGTATTIGGAEAFKIGSYYSVPHADGVLLVGLSTEGLSTLVDSQTANSDTGLPRALAREADRVSGNLMTAALILPQDVQRYGAELPARLETANIRSVAAGLAGSESLTVDLHLTMKNITTAANTAQRMRTALGETSESLSALGVDVLGEVIVIRGSTEPQAVKDVVMAIFKELFKTGTSVLDEPLGTFPESTATGPDDLSVGADTDDQ